MTCRQNPSSEPSPPPRVLGVDDWAWRRGRRYGSILIDLERNRVLDLLPDRQAETLRDWLRRHPGITVVTRDRACAYADGAIRAAAVVAVPAMPPAAQQCQEAGHPWRQARYEEAAHLHTAGTSISQVARQLGADRKTLHRWLRAGAAPSWRMPRRGSILDPHRAVLGRRWAEGCH